MVEDRGFEVRDLRAKQRFVLDNDFFNGYVKILSTNALGVYCSLCRHADKQQKAFPSINRMAAELGIHRTTVMDCMKALELFNIIKKVRIGRMCTNRYYLIDKAHWVRKDDEEVKSALATSLEDGEVASRYFSGLLRRLQEVLEATSHRKETQEKGNTKKQEAPLSKEEQQKISRRKMEIREMIASW